MKTKSAFKKILVWFVLVSFINLTGCYSHELFAPTAYKFDEKKEIKIITKDTTYNFKGHQYIFVNDTLIGSERNILLNKNAINESSVKIPVEDMQLVEVKESEGGKTALVILGGAAVIFLLVGFISFANTDWTIHI